MEDEICILKNNPTKLKRVMMPPKSTPTPTANPAPLSSERKINVAAKSADDFGDKWEYAGDPCGGNAEAPMAILTGR